MSLSERFSVGCAAALVVISALACKGGSTAPDGGPAASASVMASASAAPSATTAAVALPPITDQPIVSRLLAALSKAAGCPTKTGPNRLWCLADDFDKGERDGSLDDEGSYFGFSIGLSDDFPATQSLQKNVELSALGVDKRDGDRFAWISAIKPTDPGDKPAMLAATVELADLLKNDGYKAEIEGGLFDYVRGLGAKAKYAVTPTKDGWRIAAPSTTEVRKVGKVLVAIEVPPAVPLKGIYLSIYTDKYGKKK
ncbi:hypothetical protein BH09MYX1_BH09MYX1_20850 [soil metagenome]